MVEWRHSDDSSPRLTCLCEGAQRASGWHICSGEEVQTEHVPLSSSCLSLCWRRGGGGRETCMWPWKDLCTWNIHPVWNRNQHLTRRRLVFTLEAFIKLMCSRSEWGLQDSSKHKADSVRRFCAFKVKYRLLFWKSVCFGGHLAVWKVHSRTKFCLF